MNRDIKFRIWDKVKNKMILSAFDLIDYNIFISPFTGDLEFFERPKNIYRHPDADSIALVHWLKPFIVRENSHDFVLMQFTGLLDKNVVKIFEGDLIRSYHQRGKVTNCNGAFGCFFNPQDFTSLFSIFDRGDGHKVEVIGNIFQNNELLDENEVVK